MTHTDTIIGADIMALIECSISIGAVPPTDHGATVFDGYLYRDPKRRHRMEFFEEPASTREEILGAAYRALCQYGYTDLTIQKIGSEFDKSTSLVYHHYDGKDELLVACLEYMLETYESEFVEVPIEDPRERLEESFDEMLVEDVPKEKYQFMRALVELRGQASHDDRYRDHFTRSDRLFQSQLAAIVEAGVECGQFREVDPEKMAAMLQTFFAGWLFRRVTVDEETWIADARAEFDSFLQTRLYADE